MAGPVRVPRLVLALARRLVLEQLDVRAVPDSQRRDLIDLRPGDDVERALEESPFERPERQWRDSAEDVFEPLDRLVDVWNRDPDVIGAYEAQLAPAGSMLCARRRRVRALRPEDRPGCCRTDYECGFERNVLRVSPPWISLLTAPPSSV
jgi:hypothetical protein